MAQLRQVMLDELQRRNYAPITIKQYLRILDEFAGYFDRPLEKLGPNHIRTYQAHLFRDRKLSSRTVRQHVAALRFLFVKTLNDYRLKPVGSDATESRGTRLKPSEVAPG